MVSDACASAAGAARIRISSAATMRFMVAPGEGVLTCLINIVVHPHPGSVVGNLPRRTKKNALALLRARLDDQGGRSAGVAQAGRHAIDRQVDPAMDPFID